MLRVFVEKLITNPAFYWQPCHGAVMLYKHMTDSVSMEIKFRIAFWISSISLAMTVFARLGPPISWTQTQFLFSYDFGFQRRAIFGEFLTWIFPAGLTRSDTHLIAAAVTVFALIALFAFIVREFSTIENGGPLLVIFATSIGLGTFIGNTGNLDGLLLIWGLLVLCLPKNGLASILFASLMCAAGTLIHENMLPYFAPLVGMDIWFRHRSLTLGPKKIVFSVLPILFATAAVVLVFMQGTHPLDHAEIVLRSMSERGLDFEIREAALHPVLSSPDGLVSRLNALWGSSFYAFRLKVFGGVGLVFLVIYFRFGLLQALRKSVLDKSVVVLAVVSPLSLLFVAFDVSRFVSISLVNLFLVYAVLARRNFDDSSNTHFRMSPAIFTAVILLHGHFALRDLNTLENYRGHLPGVLLGQTDRLQINHK